VLVLVLGAGALVPGTAAPQRAPTPEPNFAVNLLPRPCAYEGGDPYEARFYELEGWKGPDYERYPGACQRLRFAYGPIHVKPGQNDVLISPITVEKPDQDGYITRFKPNLVRSDGTVPPVEQLHLHHGTWLAEPNYGEGPFFAAGEEKTIAPFPKGYGLPVKATDQWQLLYMVHSAVPQPQEVYITYDIDFIPKEKGQELGIKPAYPIWLDVRPNTAYPVFNAQRNFGNKGKCTWPKDRCAGFDPYGKRLVGQGEGGNGKGMDYQLPKQGEPLGRIDHFTGGTLIGIGGHLHPGGLHNDIDLVRPGYTAAVKRKKARARKRCKTARRKRKGHRRRARARCKKAKKKKGTAKRKSSRKATTTATAAKKKARKHRRARRCRTVRRRHKSHKRTRASAKHRKHKRKARCKRARKKRKAVEQHGVPSYWDYKDPSKPGGPPTSWDFSMRVTGAPRWGVHVKPGDILRSNATYDTKIASSYEDMGISVALIAPDDNGKPSAKGLDPFAAPKDTSDGCRSGGLQARVPKLCDKGIETHGHLKENGNHSGPAGSWNAPKGQPTNHVGIADFLYAPGDLSTISMTGVPSVKLGTDVRFSNADGHSIYHTVTSCAFPCAGATGSAFPVSNGKTSSGRQLDFDSSELGIGPPVIGPAKNELSWDLPVNEQDGFKPGEVVTYFCRIHPGMRGAFEVTK
jgi:plastocyanin